MTIARRLRLWGRVQGVGFRAAARTEARRRGLQGIARNERDGTVMIEVEGEAAAVDAFVAWCHHGPAGAEVTRVEVEAVEPSGRPDFAVGSSSVPE